MTDPNGDPYPLKDMYRRPDARTTNWEFQPTDRNRRRSRNVAPTTARDPETGGDSRRTYYAPTRRGDQEQPSFVSRGRNSRDDDTGARPRSHSRSRLPRDDRPSPTETDKITHTGRARGAREPSGTRRRDRSTHRNEVDTSRRELARTGADTRTEERRDHNRRPAGTSAPRSRSQIRERSATGERRLVRRSETRGERGRERSQSRPPSRTRSHSRPRVSSRARPSSRDKYSPERRHHDRSPSRRRMTASDREEEEGRRDERRRRRREDDDRRPRRDSSRDKGRSSHENRRSDGRRGSGEQKSSDPSLRSMAKGAAKETLKFFKSL